MIPRERYYNRIRPFIRKPVIKVITGIRRCGKSTFLKLISQSLQQEGVPADQILLINKDSLAFDFIKNYRDLDHYVKESLLETSGKAYLFIDEIQEIDGWEKAVAGFLTDQTADLYITGSNSTMLSSDLATYISGRYIEFPMYPLVFSEFLKFRKAMDPGKREEEFSMFMKYGGFPGIHHMENDDEVIRQYISALYHTILLKDVVSRNAIRDIPLLEKVSRFTANNCGNITSSKRIADYLKSQKLSGSVDTILNYLGMLSSAYLFFKVNRFDIKGKRLLEIHEKYYAGDIGLKNLLTGFQPEAIYGQLENIVYLELLSRGYSVDIGKLYDTEVDFIAKRGDQRTYIQVAYLLADQKTIDREFGSLEKIPDNHPKLVLSMDRFPMGGRNGIQWKYLIDFLLEQE